MLAWQNFVVKAFPGMHFVLSPENTLFLDRLVRTTDSEFITFSWASSLEVQLTAPDLSQLTIIRLQPTFFEELQDGPLDTVSIPTTRFHQPSMKSLRVSVSEARRGSKSVRLEYAYVDIKHTKTLNCLSVDMFDLDFVTKKSFGVCLAGIGGILGKGALEVSIGSELMIQGKTTRISVEGYESCEKIRFVIEADRLRNILSVADRFYESSLCFSEEQSPLNIVLQAPEVHYSTFVSIE